MTFQLHSIFETTLLEKINFKNEDEKKFGITYFNFEWVLLNRHMFLHIHKLVVLFDVWCIDVT